MRIAGSASPCSTPTVNSPPVIQRSAITTGSSAEAARQAAGSSAAVATRLMPTLEPWVAGFTASGSPSSATARSKSAAPVSSHPRRRRDARRLRKPLGAQLVHADRGAEDAAAGIRQPQPLERALHRAVLAARSVQRDEHAVEAGRHELAERAFRRVEAGRVDRRARAAPRARHCRS